MYLQSYKSDELIERYANNMHTGTVLANNSRRESGPARLQDSEKSYPLTEASS